MNPLSAIRRKFDIVPNQHRPRPLLVGTVVLIVIGIALLSAGLRHIPLTPVSGTVMTAEFHDADNVTNRTVVRVHGVEVGRVESVHAGSDPYSTSAVVMRISDPSIHLHRDASAHVRWRTILGGLMYIDLNPGSASAPPLDGPIPASRTSHQVELDQLLEVYRNNGIQQQRNVFHGLRDTFSSPAGLGRTLRALAPGLRTVGNGLSPLQGTDTGDLKGLVQATAGTVSGLDDSAGLQALVTGAAHTLAVTDDRRRQLGQTLHLSPPSLRSTFVTMTKLRATLGHLDPLVANLKPGAQLVGPAAQAAAPALGRLDSVLHTSKPLLAAAGPTFDSLRAASGTGVPLMQQLNPTLTRMLGNILPYLRSKDSSTNLAVYEMVGPFWSSLAMAAGGYDAVGYRIRFSAPLGSNSLIMDNPLTANMRSACHASALTAQPGACSKAVQVLSHGWFGR